MQPFNDNKIDMKTHTHTTHTHTTHTHARATHAKAVLPNELQGLLLIGGGASKILGVPVVWMEETPTCDD